MSSITDSFTLSTASSSTQEEAPITKPVESVRLGGYESPKKVSQVRTRGSSDELIDMEKQTILDLLQEPFFDLTFDEMEMAEKLAKIFEKAHIFSKKDDCAEFAETVVKIEGLDLKKSHFIPSYPESSRQSNGMFNIHSDLMIGRGVYKTTFKNYQLNPHTGEMIETTRQHIRDPQYIPEACEEIKLQQSFDHPNIVKVFDTISDGGERLEIYTEICDFPLDKLFNEPEFLSYPEIAKALSGAASGLDHLHGLGYAHNDIKADNIMVKEGVGKLIDFGVSLELGKKPLARLPRLAAPEQRNSPDHYGVVTPKTDVYQFGILLCALFHPDEEIRADYQNPLIIDRMLPSLQEMVGRWDAPEGSKSGMMRTLAIDCLSEEPEFRPSMQQISEILLELSN